MKRVMIIAGEASGDLHAAKLVKAVHLNNPDIEFFGIGGEDMRKAGVKTLVDSADLAVVGLFEVLAHRKIIFGALEQMRELLRTFPPDLLLLTDYPEFNLRLAKTAKELGIKVLYYISPQVWAWRQKRVHTIRERVDMMAVVFPFEEEFYRQHNVPVRFVGHPLVDEVISSQSITILRNEFSLSSKQPVVGLFPGSRRSEIKRLLPIILKTASRLQQQRPDIQFVMPLASTIPEDLIKPALEHSGLDIRLIKHRSHDVIEACDIILTVSGTVTLEIALLEKPMVIINKVNWLTYLIVSRMLKIDYIGLCNIVAGKQIVPEFSQYRARPSLLVKEIIHILDNAEYRNSMVRELALVREKLGGTDGIRNIARLTVEMLET